MPQNSIQHMLRGFAGSHFGDVMLVGGGVSGVQASLDLATAKIVAVTGDAKTKQSVRMCDGLRAAVARSVEDLGKPQ